MKSKSMIYLFSTAMALLAISGCGSSSNSSTNQEGEGYKRLDSNLETIPENDRGQVIVIEK